MVVNGKKIYVFQEREKKEIKWGKDGDEYVVEYNGVLKKIEKDYENLEGGDKKVIIYENSDDEKMFVVGVKNE